MPSQPAVLPQTQLSGSPWKGSKALYTFDFNLGEFHKQQDMTDGRWYPSVINTRGGYALIVGGFDAKGQQFGFV